MVDEIPEQSTRTRSGQPEWADLLRQADEAQAVGDRDRCVKLIEELLARCDKAGQAR